MTAEVIILLFLFILNGFFAMSELAILSSSRVGLHQRADQGDRKARIALKLAENPGRFLSTVQVGITLIGILAGALGGATLGRQFAEALERSFGFSGDTAGIIGIGSVVLIITYVSLIIGELVPKRLALIYADRIAIIIAPAMQMLSIVAAPIVTVLSRSTEGILKLLGLRGRLRPPVSEEEIRMMIKHGTQIGIFHPSERAMVERIFRLADRKISSLMTPRGDIAWLDINDSTDGIVSKITNSTHSRFPVANGGLEKIVGIVSDRDFLIRFCKGKRIDLKIILEPALFVPENMPALLVLERFKEVRSQMALVLDEYGGVEGLVTDRDILESIAGEMPEPREEPEAIQREDGSWLLDGGLAIDEFKEIFSIKELPDEGQGYYETLGGFVLYVLEHIPDTGEHFEWNGLYFEILDMDGLRIDKVLVKKGGDLV